MKKLLYICFINLDDNEETGIQKKIKKQIDTFREFGIDVDCLCFSHKNSDVNFSKYDSVYIRFDTIIDSFLLMQLAKAKDSGCRVVMEIPTYPFNSELLMYAKTFLLKGHFMTALLYVRNFLRNILYSPRLKKYVDIIITFSLDTSIYGITCINISNGVDIDSIPFVSKKHIKGNDIHAVCVSSCIKWHGYDRFIKGMADYYKGNHDRIVIFDIVGDGDAVADWKKITSDNGLEAYVIFHGRKNGVELDEVYSHADVAIDSLGRHRSGVYYNSSLKGKEYAAMGLSIVSGVETELDYDLDFKYYLRVPADDSNIDILEVVKFVDRVYEDNNVTENIRQYARDHFDYNVIMNPIIEYIQCTT